MNLDEAMKNINKKFKSDIIHRGVSEYDYERIPFTSPRLNYMTYGGVPVGKLIEFYGDEGSGKTTTALDVVANYQHGDDDRTVLYVDAENTLDVVWASKLGVSVDDMIIINPENQGAETLFQIVLDLMKTGEIGFVVIDSLGVLCSNKELDEDVTLDDAQYAGISKALTGFSKQAEMLAHKHKCTVIGINQERDIMNSPYGGKRTVGGKAWKYNVSMRLNFRKGDSIDSHYKTVSSKVENPVGHKVQVALIKSKTCAGDRRTGFYTLRYDIGIDYLFDTIELCLKYGIVEQSGAWYSVINPQTGEHVTKVQGQASVSTYLEENPEVLQQVEGWLDEKLKGGTV